MTDLGLWMTIGIGVGIAVVGELTRPQFRKDEERRRQREVRIERVYGVHGIVVGYRYFVGKVETDITGQPLRPGEVCQRMGYTPVPPPVRNVRGYRHALGLPPGPEYVVPLVPINLARARAMWVGGKKQQKVTA